MSSADLGELPSDPLTRIISELDLPDLVQFCSSSKEMAKRCRDPQTWKYRFLREFGLSYPPYMVEYEPLVEYLLQRISDREDRIKNLETELLTEMREFYLDSALDSQVQAMKDIYTYLFQTQQIHQGPEVVELREKYDRDFVTKYEYHMKILQARTNLARFISAPMLEKGVVELRSGLLIDFIDLVSRRLVEYQAEKIWLVDDLNSTGDALKRRLRLDIYQLRQLRDWFEARLPAPLPHVGPFTFQFPETPLSRLQDAQP